MDPALVFFFYLAALICFVIAAFGDAYTGRSRRRLDNAARLIPLGLALALVPTLWNAAVAAF